LVVLVFGFLVFGFFSNLVIAGGVTERARDQLEAAGWAVEAGVGLAE
jgi:hypothetical protein